ncbi:MAG: glycosyltransferase family A protein [Pseudomonadales bacterium]
MSELSVIIPTFNRSGMLVEAINSVLRQETVRGLEIIVVDDGSTDDTSDLIAQFGDAVTYLKQTNAGVNAARNLGIARSSGHLVAFLDDDDVWLPYKSAVQIEALSRFPEAGFVFSDFFVWRGEKRSSGGLRGWQEAEWGMDTILAESPRVEYLDAGGERSVASYLCDIYGLSLVQPVVLPSTAICRREALQRVGPFPEFTSICGDWQFFAEMSRTCGAVYVDLETALNRSHDNVRLTRTDAAIRIRERLDMIERVWESSARLDEILNSELFETQGRLQEALFRTHALAGRSESAIEVFGAMRKSGWRPGLKSYVLRTAISFPRGGEALAITRRALQGSND